MTDEVTTSDLAAWFGLTRAGVIKALRSAGVEPSRPSRARTSTRWPRLEAYRALQRRGSRHA